MRKELKRPAAFFFAFFAMGSGCNSGSVAVTQDAPPSKAATPVVSADHGGSPPGDAPASDGSIYFDTFQINRGAIGHAIGVGFLPTASEITSAFELRLPCSLNGTGVGCLFVPIAGGFDYIEPGSSGDTLSLLQVASLRATTLLQTTTPLGALAVDPDGKWTATSDKSAVIQIKLGRQTRENITLPAGNALRLTGSRLGALLVTTDVSTLLLYSIVPESTLVPQKSWSRVSVSAIDSIGDQIAWIASGRENQIGIWSRSSGKEQTVPAPSGTIADLAFSDEGSLIFRLDSAATGSQVVRVDIASGNAEIVASLSPDMAAGSGVTCPVGDSGQIYFADRSETAYSIFRATASSSGWTISPFAVPTLDDVAYTCPRARTGQGGSP